MVRPVRFQCRGPSLDPGRELRSHKPRGQEESVFHFFHNERVGFFAFWFFL